MEETIEIPGSRRTMANAGFTLLLVAVFLANFYQKTMFFRPNSIHQWRQTDCLSIAKNYYEEGMHFFSPSIHFQGPIEGKAVSEFPILNYTAAALWKVFGEHEFIYRLLNFGIYLLALFVVFNTVLGITRKGLSAFIVAGLLISSPLLTYYSMNFLSDVPGLSLCLIGFCCFYQYIRHRRIWLFYVAVAASTLAVLVKASAFMSLALIMLFSVADLAGKGGKLGNGSLFVKKRPVLIALILSFAAIASWYFFALHYNRFYTNVVFLLGFLPIWEMNFEEIMHNLSVLCNDQFPVFHNRMVLAILLLLTILVATRQRQLPAILRWAFLLSAGYFVVYLILFFQVFGIHDYYLVNLMFFPFVTVFSFVYLFSSYMHTKEARVTAAVVLVFSMLHAAAIYRMRTIEDDKLLVWYPFISKQEKDFAKYMFWDYSRNTGRIEKITPKLRELGIQRSERVLSIPDGSFDISLYLMDQKGYTIARDHIENDSTVADRFVGKVKYVILADTLLANERAFQRIKDHYAVLRQLGPVRIYRAK